MNSGMLWLGSNFGAASEYHTKKYGRIPDIVEVNPKFLTKIGMTEKIAAGMRIVPNKEVQYGTILVGVDGKDFKYNIKEG